MLASIRSVGYPTVEGPAERVRENRIVARLPILSVVAAPVLLVVWMMYPHVVAASVGHWMLANDHGVSVPAAFNTYKLANSVGFA